MKKRIGFVSNSSSESFICDVCGSTHSGWDADPHDFGMVCCTYHHTFCEDHAVIPIPEKKDEWDKSYGIPAECCPVCNMREIRERDLTQYLLKKVGMTEDQVEAEIKAKYPTISEFQQFMNDIYPKKESK